MDGPLRGHVFDLDAGLWSLGRGGGNRITIVIDPSLSRRHCLIEWREDVLWLNDLNSHNWDVCERCAGAPARLAGG